MKIRPEFLPSSSCGSRPPFRGALSLIVGSRDDLVLRSLRFDFVDRLGRRTSPLVSPAGAFAGVTTSIPTSGPLPIQSPGSVTIPGSSPVTLPGIAPVNGVLLTANTFRTLPFAFEFGCGVHADGTLLIDVETSDRKGRRGSSEVRVTVGN